MKFLKIVAMVMAGGEGTRLAPLTAERSKPAVPFAGRYRIVDFVLSNLMNSEIHSIYLLVQYKSQSLIEHIDRSWRLSYIVPDQFVTVVPPQMRDGMEWFQGTADAVSQNANLIAKHDPDLVLVFGADHIYRMDVRQMILFHQEAEADVTVSALPVPLAEASSFGVIAADADGRVRDFQEKPAHPPAMPGDPQRAYASMGNYVFKSAVLHRALAEAKQRNESDFGRHVLPRLMKSHRVFAYDFARNRVPGVRPYEEPAYWRDVGTLDAYFAANMDTLGLEPRFNLFNPRWSINSSNYQGPIANIAAGELSDTVVGAGSLIKGARLKNCIVRREVVIEEGAELEECIVMDYSIIRRGARLRRAIVDRYNEIPAGTRIGYDAKDDRRRYHVSDSGIVVVPKGDYTNEELRYR